MNLASIVQILSNIMVGTRMPAPTLPPLLLKSTSLARPGLSAYKITAKIIENNRIVGIPTEPLPDGSENKLNQYTYNVVKCIVDALKEDAVIQVAVPMESLVIQTVGANAGGPVTCIGTNMTDSISKGIIE